MKVSTKGRYALRVMIDLALHKDDGYISLKDIADRQNISKNYLDQIMILLKKGDFFDIALGYRGGYKLKKDINTYTVREILRLTEGDVVLVSCLEKELGNKCALNDCCIAKGIWQGLETIINTYLDDLTLKTIIDKHKKRTLSKVNSGK